MNKCPYCNSSSIMSNGNGTYKCDSCGSTFSESDMKTSTKESAFSKLAYARTSMHSNSSMNGLSGDKLYERYSPGCAIVECYDLHCAGSGLLIDSLNRLVLTNCHVVTDGNVVSNNVKVTIAGEQINARVLFVSPTNVVDLAMLQLERLPRAAVQLSLGSFSEIKNGETVYTIGNPLGEGLSITTGIISDKDRIIDRQHLMLTSVTINHGNSGGPLFNSQGHVIGICVAVRTNADGMGYAIPIDDAMVIVTSYLNKHRG